MLSHRGPVLGIAVDTSGRYMATSGNDGNLRIFDIRTYQVLHEYLTAKPATSINISQTGMLATAQGPHVKVWKDGLSTKQEEPYINHRISGCIAHRIKFVPYDDVLGIGHSDGVSSIIVPGSGEPNFDSFEANPFITSKQSKESAVHSLLEKIPSSMITLDPEDIRKVDKVSSEILRQEKEERMAARASSSEDKTTKGKRAIARRMKSKQANVIAERKGDMRTYQMNLKNKLEQQNIEKEKQRQKALWADTPPDALDRFRKK